MNQNLKVDEEDNDDNSLILSDVQYYIDDEKIDLNMRFSKNYKIIF